MIMFIAVMALSVTVVTVFKNVVDDTTTSLKIQGDAVSNSLKTDITIESMSYSNITDITSVGLRNTGRTKLDISMVDIYLDGEYIPRNDTNRTIIIEPTTDVRNPGIWDTNEIVTIEIFKTLQDGDHVLAISSQYSYYVEDIFASP
ncbi:MAG: hypothetical protein KC535_05455 [Nanoarchaeota archaeon]|nr:hypothetical protein [Nanoarchaeota archaeon]